MKAYYAHELMKQKEFWVVYYQHIQTNLSTEGPFLTKESADNFAKEYINGDSKNLRAKVVRKMVIEVQE